MWDKFHFMSLYFAVIYFELIFINSKISNVDVSVVHSVSVIYKFQLHGTRTN